MVQFKEDRSVEVKPAVLPLRDPDLLPSALLWKFLLEDLHPELDLAIELRPEKKAIGV